MHPPPPPPPSRKLFVTSGVIFDSERLTPEVAAEVASLHAELLDRLDDGRHADNSAVVQSALAMTILKDLAPEPPEFPEFPA